jgi:hypothetical protein
MGSSGKSSGSAQVILDPAQRQALEMQTNYMAQQIPHIAQASQLGASNVSQAVSGAQDALGEAQLVAKNTAQTVAPEALKMYGAGSQGLAALFDPNYEKNQINAALQAGRESARESLQQQNAMYGGAGSLGSSRQALADKNLASLNTQRQATAAAEAQAKVQANKAAAANQLMTGGLAGLNQALSSNIQTANAASSPMDAISKYAAIASATPTGPNFAGTQGQESSSKGKGISI